MKLWISGEVDTELYDSFRNVRGEVQETVNRLLSRADYGSSLQEWAVIPILTSTKLPDYPEVAKLEKKDIAEFRLRIPRDVFAHASAEGRRRLLLDLLIRSVKMMEGIGVQGLDASDLVRDLDRLKNGAEGQGGRSVQ